jgi:hypothetical protein
MTKSSGTAAKQIMRSIRRRAFLAQRFAAKGQMATISHVPQTGYHAFPAKVLDANTRALIDAALAAKPKEN